MTNPLSTRSRPASTSAGEGRVTLIVSGVVVVAIGAVALRLAFLGGGTRVGLWAPLGALVAALLLLLGATGALPGRPRLSLWSWIGMAGLAGVALLAVLSLAWTDTPTLTAESAGLWVLTALLLALATWASVGWAAIATVAVLVGGPLVVAGAVLARLLASSPDVFLQDRLSWPINYANAMAALLLVGAPAALALASQAALPRVARAALVGAAAVLVATAALTVSRGAIVGLVASAIVLGLVAPTRPRLVLMAVPTALGVAVALPLLFSGESAVGEGVPGRGHGMIVAALVAAAAAAAILLVERRLASAWRRRAVRWTTAGAAGAAIVAGIVVLVLAVGAPWTAAREVWSDFSGSTPVALSTRVESRLLLAQSNRYEYWRVALGTLADQPAVGQGAGGFALEWYEDRRVTEFVTDAHGWPFGVAADFGVAGLLLFAATVAAVVAAAASIHARGRSPSGAVGAAAAGSAAYFLVHAAVDWLFLIPAVSALGMLAVGACLASGAPRAGRLAEWPTRGVAVLVAALALVALGPLWISDRYLERAEGQIDPRAAVADLESARDWNPFSIRPLQVEADVRVDAGDLQGARRAIGRAIADEPRRWESWVQLSEILMALDRPAAGARALRRAKALNPLGFP